MKHLVIGMLLTIIICGAPAAHAEEPMAALRKPIDQAISLLNDPAYQGPEKQAAQRERFWQLIREVFDFTEVSKRALARNWRLFSAEQKKRFAAVFSELLGHTYLNKIQSEYQNETVEYLGQEVTEGEKALVKTKILRQNIEIPIDYRMLKTKGGWKVYDVYVEGVSLVKNYRTQFNKILFRKKPDHLIQRLEEKVKLQKDGVKTSHIHGFPVYMAALFTDCRQNAGHYSLTGEK